MNDSSGDLGVLGHLRVNTSRQAVSLSHVSDEMSFLRQNAIRLPCKRAVLLVVRLIKHDKSPVDCHAHDKLNGCTGRG